MSRFYAALLVGLLVMTGAETSLAQSSVGIGTTTPNASAILDLSSTAKGLLVPRLTSAQRAAIGTPAVGLLVYQTDGSEGFYFYSAGGWTWLNPLGGADNLGNHTATQNLNLNGHKLTGGGTNGLTVSNTGALAADNLAGTGTRMLTADATGNLAAQAIPVDTDTDAQQLTKSGNVISLTNGGSVTDSDNQQIARVGNSLTITNGSAVFLPDVSSFNELQTISKTGNVVTLSDGGGSFTDADTDAQTLSVSGGNLSISGGNSVALTSLDAQQLSKTGSTISLTNGGAVTDSDNQSLSISGSTINLTNGGSVTVPSSADNLGNHTATQDLNLGTNTLTGNGGSTGLRISANGRLLTTADNLIAGKNTGNGTLSGINNTVLGAQSGSSLTSGVANTLTGVNAGFALTTGSNNTFNGVGAGDNTTTGSSNVALGRSSGSTNVTGSSLTMLGAGADVIGTGLTNATAVGRNAKVSQSNSLVLGGTGGSAVNVGIGTTAPTATLEVAGATSTVRLGGLTGTGTRLVNVDDSGNLSTQTVASVGDNLGNHTATQNLDLGTNQLVGNGGTVGLSISSTGVTSAGNNINLNANSLVGNGGTVGLSISSTGVTSAGNNINLNANSLVGNGGTVGLSISNTGVTTAGNNLNLGPNRLVGNGGTVGLSISSTGVTTAGNNLNLGTSKLVGGGGTIGLSINSGGITTVDNNLNLGTSRLVGNGGTGGINIASNGNVGINESNPNHKLDIVGGVKISEAVFARALAGIEYEVEIGPDNIVDNQDHIVQCSTGWAITGVQAYATTHLDGNMSINCMRLSGIIDESAPAVWRYGPGVGADNQNHTVNCQSGEVATGWRITATDYLDGNVGLLCRPLAAGYSRSTSISTTTMQSTLDSRGLNDSFIGATCPAGTVLIYMTLYARDRLETLLDMRCARIIAP